MAGRSSRSPAAAQSTAPISSPSRIEDVLNMHSIPSPSPNPRAQRMSFTSSPNHPPGRRNLYASSPQHDTGSPSMPHNSSLMGNGVGGSRSSPIMPSAASSRPTSRTMSSNFVPRIVRGTIAGREATSASSSNGSPSNARISPTSSTRTRRTSGTVTAISGNFRTASTSSAPSAAVPPPSHTISFPRPSYLDHCALRHYIQSGNNPDVPPDRYRFDSLRSGTTPVGVGRPRDVSRDVDSDEESSVSNEDRERTIPPPRLPPRKPADAVMHLPTRWSDQDRCPSLSVSADGRELTFHGPTQGEKEAAAARTNFPAPAASGIYYYEIEIINRGQKGHISIGFGTSTVRLSRLPGWEGQSWGYHGDDGNSFASEREGSPYGPKFTTGDIVGCGIDYSQGRAFFTKNGRYLGPVFENLSSAGDMYPSVGLRTPNEAIRANFGHEQFVFDIDSHVAQERNRAWARIQDTAVMWKTPGTFAVNPASRTRTSEVITELENPVNELILAYLAHHGYAKTARAFKAQLETRNMSPNQAGVTTADDMETDAEVMPALINSASPSNTSANMTQDDTLKRQRIVRAIVNGDMDTALEETRAHYPRVLEREQGLVQFKLRCRKFVELVLEAATALRKTREEEARSKGKDVNGVVAPVQDGELMDVDDYGSAPVINGDSSHNATDSKPPKVKPVVVATPFMSTYQSVLASALAFGQSLKADYKSDTRSEVQAIFKRTLSLVAYDDPLSNDQTVPDAVKDMAGQAAREHLAEEINRAILESQGRPPHPALERLYRQTQACVMQLGWLGVGVAAFADMPKEFLDA